ncbi:PREDICTED: uncharacterized protein LOC108662432 [Theobroma cacao]|uniref:Uncharacterized protein LOC108662432 n=1 Tax=Theobroma cacao TaxID=3641 RepID=A0AB32WKP8_THECC|nr:PREDICTED: uncharacterized protein LOC108662432 [Theobroma cacao]
MVQEAERGVQVIREKMPMAQSHHKSCTNNRCKPLEFEVGDYVFLKISPTKRVKRFGKKGKLSPRYIDSFEVLKRISIVAYHLALPPNLSNVHLVFHVPMLRKYVPNPSHVIWYDEVQLQNGLGYKEQPIAILGRQVNGFTPRILLR